MKYYVLGNAKDQPTLIYKFCLLLSLFIYEFYFLFAETPIWLLVHIAPIKNDKNQVVLYLCQFKDITPLKRSLDDENNKGLMKFQSVNI